MDECKRLPLALKVIGSSLRDQPEIYWTSAKNRLSRSQPICESHEVQLLERMKLSIDYLPGKVRECFLDLGSFPEDKKIPLDVLINMWVELHDIDEEEAFAILVELSNKNLLTLVKDSRYVDSDVIELLGHFLLLELVIFVHSIMKRGINSEMLYIYFPSVGDLYSTYYEISVFQHDVLRDLAIHLSNLEDVNHRKRLVMSRREERLPKEWERNVDQPFNARIVSVHTGIPILFKTKNYVNESKCKFQGINQILFDLELFQVKWERWTGAEWISQKQKYSF